MSEARASKTLEVTRSVSAILNEAICRWPAIADRRDPGLTGQPRIR